MQPITYMTSLFTFYLQGEIKSEQNFISFKVPNTILGLIPLGAQTEKFTISQIASTATNTLEVEREERSHVGNGLHKNSSNNLF